MEGVGAFWSVVVVPIIYLASPRFRKWHARQNWCLMWLLFGLFPWSLYIFTVGTVGITIWTLVDGMMESYVIYWIGAGFLTGLSIAVYKVRKKDEEQQRIRNAIALEAIRQETERILDEVTPTAN